MIRLLRPPRKCWPVFPFFRRRTCYFRSESEHGAAPEQGGHHARCPRSRPPAENLVGWERSLIAFLVEKERRSGSLRTVEGYSRMLQDFFGRLSKTPDEVTAQDVFIWAHGKGLSGKDPAPITIGARMACVSSFFRFLMRMEIVDRNPCDRLERPRTTPSPPRGLSALDVQKLLAAVPDTRVGLRNRALLLTLLLTGRRRAEVFRLTRGDLSFAGDVCFYSYRGKGGKTGRRELPQPAVEALRAALRARGTWTWR